MSALKVLSVVGARPQFIKAAPVSRALRQADIADVLVHTGQHYDASMSARFFDELGIPAPQHNLSVGSGKHGAQTGRMLELLEPLIEAERPDWVVVYGDTNSTLAGALAAAKLHVAIAHVEAGLRSFNRAMPEEINRIATDSLSRLLLTPTDAARENLVAEGVADARMRQVGDVMFDASLHFGAEAEKRSDVLDRMGLQRGGYVLATIHRAANTDDPHRMDNLVGALAEIGATLPVVLPMHPRTRARLGPDALHIGAAGAVRVTEPLGYLDMVMLEKNAALIATDSGGVQKEAFFHRVPCVTLREETEWVELVDAGWNRLAPPIDRGGIVRSMREALGSTGRDVSPYGDGRAAEHIATALRDTSPEWP